MRLSRLAQQRALHVAVIIVNKLYLGRYASLEELERCPNSWQRKRLSRLRAFYVACGSYQEEFPLAPGRSGPELGAMIFQMERFVGENPLLAQHYHEPANVDFTENPDLLPPEDFPELAPYKALDVSRLKLVGTGKWPMADFLHDALWLPYVEPRFLAHGEEIDEENIPNFAAEKETENLKLVKLWDSKGLARCFASPLWPGQFSRVFNAHKSAQVDRQIGDRRLPNAQERHLDGPSRHLPPGPLLCNLWVPRHTHCLRGTITDRRDFYHQAAVSSSRARSNCLPFAFGRNDLSGLDALEVFDAIASKKKKQKDREIIGDELGPPQDDGFSPADSLYIGFSSLFQGDHLGVEFALSSHECLLQEEGLLPASQRILGHHPVPDSGCWQALVIDDFFCISSQPVSWPKADSFAFKALARAREAYDQHKLEGSVEKDVVAETKFKAAGAEINSDPVCTALGMVLVGAPLGKRIGLSTLSLRACSLPCITSRLASRLSGNWVSVLLYRRCWSSLVSKFFSMAAVGEKSFDNKLLGLPRGIAEELVSLAAIVPLIASNVATPYSGIAFASDASLASGAVVSAEIGEDVARKLWLGSNKRGHYTRLENTFAAALRAVGEGDEVFGEDPFSGPRHIYKAPLLYFDFVEVCGGSGVLSREVAALGLVVAPVLDLSYSEFYDLGSLRFLEWLLHMVSSGRFQSFFIAPPCTTFSPAAYPSCRSYALPLGYDRSDGKTFHGNLLAFNAFTMLRAGRRSRRPCGLEQPRRSKMCWTPMWRSLVGKEFFEAVLASCQFGSIHQKEFRLLVFLLSAERLEIKCPGGHEHVPIQGKYTKPSATYVKGLARHIALEFRRTLEWQRRTQDDAQPAVGLESVLSNDVLLSSTWTLLSHHHWKHKKHINVFETDMALQVLRHQCRFEPETRFVSFLDSQVWTWCFGQRKEQFFLPCPSLPKVGSIPDCWRAIPRLELLTNSPQPCR